MRLPLVPSLSTKNGVSNKNARMTNVLKESKKTGDMAVVRPGLTLNATASGVGNGLVVFNDELISVFGTTLGIGAGTDGTDAWVLDVTGNIAMAEGFDATAARIGVLGIFINVSNSGYYYYRINEDLSITQLTASFYPDFTGNDLAKTCNNADGAWVYWIDGDIVNYFFTDGITPVEDVAVIDLQGMSITSINYAAITPAGTKILSIGLDGDDWYYTSTDGINFSIGALCPTSTFPTDQQVVLGSTIYAYSCGDTAPPQDISYTSSTDGFTWSAYATVTGIQGSLETVFSMNGTIYMGFGDEWPSFTRINDLYSSTDGATFSLTWANVLPTPVAYPLLYGDGTNLYIIETQEGDIYVNTGTGGTGTIDTLATVDGPFFDFVQGVL